MKVEDAKVGMKVRVLPTATKEKYANTGQSGEVRPGWNEAMHALVGEVLIVGKLHPSYAEKNWVRAGNWYWLAEDLEPVVKVQAETTYPNPPNKHKEFIIAWANGADIEYRSFGDTGSWSYTPHPWWSSSLEYRIKPQQKKEPPKPEWIKVDGVRPEGIPDGTRVVWVGAKSDWLDEEDPSLIDSLVFDNPDNKVLFIKIVP